MFSSFSCCSGQNKTKQKKRAHSFILQSPEMLEQRQPRNEDLTFPGNKSDVDWQVKSCPACLESQMSPPAAWLGPFLLSKHIFQSAPLSLQHQSHFPILRLDRSTEHELPLAHWLRVWDFCTHLKAPGVTKTAGCSYSSVEFYFYFFPSDGCGPFSMSCSSWTFYGISLATQPKHFHVLLLGTK